VKICGSVEEEKAYGLILFTPPLFFHFTVPLMRQEFSTTVFDYLCQELSTTVVNSGFQELSTTAVDS
jgi:hypothetical protein